MLNSLRQKEPGQAEGLQPGLVLIGILELGLAERMGPDPEQTEGQVLQEELGPTGHIRLELGLAAAAVLVVVGTVEELVVEAESSRQMEREPLAEVQAEGRMMGRGPERLAEGRKREQAGRIL